MTKSFSPKQTNKQSGPTCAVEQADLLQYMQISAVNQVYWQP